MTSAAFGMLAPFLAIVGAAVGGNLLLVALDIAWDQQARDRFAEAKDTLEAQPSVR